MSVQFPLQMAVVSALKNLQDSTKKKKSRTGKKTRNRQGLEKTAFEKPSVLLNKGLRL